MAPLKIGFMGTPDFAASALRALLETPHNIACVYSQPPRPKGRGQKVQKSPVHMLADEHGIPVFTPRNLKTAESQEEFAAHGLDVAIVAAYGLILPPAILNAPRYGCLNIHASLLPRWRGASPIQHAIWKGDAESGITIMQMDKGLDTGPMIALQSLPLTNETTAQSLHDELAALGGEMSVRVLEDLAQNGKLESTPQDNGTSTYAPLLNKDDGRVEWSQTAQEIDRQIRALNPWPGTWTMYDDKPFKIKVASVSEGETSATKIGEILDRDGHVSCGHNTVLKIQTIQPPNKSAMDFNAALNGGYIKTGTCFQ